MWKNQIRRLFFGVHALSNLTDGLDSA